MGDCNTCKFTSDFDATNNKKNCKSVIDCISNNYKDYEKEEDSIVVTKEIKTGKERKGKMDFIEKDWLNIILGLIWLIGAVAFFIIIVIISTGTFFHNIGSSSLSSTIEWSLEHYIKLYKLLIGFLVYEVIFNIYRLIHYNN